MPLLIAYSPNYYSIDDILATQERIPCKFIQTIPKLGKFNTSAEEADLKAGTRLEVPLWLTMDIAAGRQPLVAPELPKVYTESYREILKADACAVDLHKFGLHFYEVGGYAKHFDIGQDVTDMLVHTFTARFRKIMDLADNSVSEPSAVLQLDMLERGLFKNANAARAKLSCWLKQSIAPLEAAAMVVNHKKRKRAQLDLV